MPSVRTDGPDVCAFLEGACRVTKGDGAGKLVELHDWQRELLDDLFELGEDGTRRYRRGLIGLPRKNGKSFIGAGLALFGLFMDGEQGAEVYSVAGDRDQARIVFQMARRMVEMDPFLADRLRVFRDVIEHPDSGSIYKVLSADAPRHEGLNPSMVLFDEVHVQPDRKLWDVLSLGSGTRSQPLLLGITTAGVKSDRSGSDSLCYGLYQYGKRVEAGEIDDPSFFFRWWQADEDADWRSESTWMSCNPALGAFLRLDDFRAAVLNTPENEFRTKRLNQWVSSSQAWLPQGAWDECASTAGAPADGTAVVLGFDGSYSGDSTALVGCTMDGHLFVVDAWERAPADGPDWRVDILQVENAIRVACARWSVKEIACDPYRWQRSMAVLMEEGFPIVEYPTGSPGRMVPACATFYDAVMEQRLTHDTDPRLARHVENCVLKIDQKGPRIVKEHRMSPRKIDLAVCAVIAYERAMFYAEAPSVEPLSAWV